MKKNTLSEAAKVIAKAGGVATLKKHGKKHYKAMAKKRWAKANTKIAPKDWPKGLAGKPVTLNLKAKVKKIKK